jgi:hypothetical protein
MRRDELKDSDSFVCIDVTIMVKIWRWIISWYRSWGWLVLAGVDLVILWVIVAAVVKLWP